MTNDDRNNDVGIAFSNGDLRNLWVTTNEGRLTRIELAKDVKAEGVSVP